MTKIIPNNIAKLREEKNISQIELANKLGITVFHMNKMERHKKPVTTTTALRIAEVLSVTLNDIFLQWICSFWTKKEDVMKIKPSKEACERYYRFILPAAIEIAKKKKEEEKWLAKQWKKSAQQSFLW